MFVCGWILCSAGHTNVAHRCEVLYRLSASNPALLGGFFHGKSGFHPPLLSFGIVRYFGIAHSRQLTGGVFAGVSMSVRAIGDDLRVLVGQQLRRELFDFFWRNVQGSGNVRLTVAFLRECLDYLDWVLPVELGFKVLVEMVRSILTSWRTSLRCDWFGRKLVRGFRHEHSEQRFELRTQA